MSDARGCLLYVRSPDRVPWYAFVQKRAALSCAQRVRVSRVSCCVCNPRPVLSTGTVYRLGDRDGRWSDRSKPAFSLANWRRRGGWYTDVSFALAGA
eukprot:4596921-Prymnesium_polylepis.1